MKHIVDHDPLQNAINYLGTRPYKEVAKIIKDLMDSITANKPKPESAFPTNEPDTIEHEPK